MLPEQISVLMDRAAIKYREDTSFRKQHFVLINAIQAYKFYIIFPRFKEIHSLCLQRASQRQKIVYFK